MLSCRGVEPAKDRLRSADQLPRLTLLKLHFYVASTPSSLKIVSHAVVISVRQQAGPTRNAVPIDYWITAGEPGKARAGYDDEISVADAANELIALHQKT